MATINQQSIRAEVERLQADFERLSSDKKINTESSVLINTLLMLVNLLIAIFLEKTTKKTNKNSSKPSSKSDKDESSTTNNGSNGKGKKESNITADNTRTIEHVTVVNVTECDICGQDLREVDCEHIERRTKIDIIFEKKVEHVDVEIKICPECESTNKAIFPPDMQGPLQYGNGLKAFIINLIICQMVALGRVQKLVASIIGEVIAQASLLNFIQRLYFSLEQWELSATEQILKSPAMNVDETTLRVDKKNQWIHVYSAGDITLKFLHAGRGTEAINDINIIPRYSGAIIHDCLAAYFTYTHCEHGVCGAHIVRELEFVINSNNYRWAANMRSLLLEICKRISKRKNKKLNNKEYANLQKRYRNILTRGEKELPIIPPKPSGKRGKIAKSDAHNLLERLQKHEDAVLLFAKKSDVSFTNNRAERDLRMAKVKQKISGCFRNELYAKAYCRISSYLQTRATQGYNPLIAIQMALDGNFSVDRGE